MGQDQGKGMLDDQGIVAGLNVRKGELAFLVCPSKGSSLFVDAGQASQLALRVAQHLGQVQLGIGHRMWLHTQGGASDHDTDDISFARHGSAIEHHRRRDGDSLRWNRRRCFGLLWSWRINDSRRQSALLQNKLR